MSGSFLFALAERFEGLEAHLNRLDAAIGDGDHGTTILRGLKAAATSNDPAAKAFRMAAGGASGSLFGFLIGALEATEEKNTEEKTTSLGEALSKAARQISEVGQARAGDKTMLDALIPAAAAALADPDEPARAAAIAARTGAEKTRTLAAKRGRARYVENGGAGHVDAGAVSVAEILGVLETYIGSTR